MQDMKGTVRLDSKSLKKIADEVRAVGYSCAIIQAKDRSYAVYVPGKDQYMASYMLRTHEDLSDFLQKNCQSYRV